MKRRLRRARDHAVPPGRCAAEQDLPVADDPSERTAAAATPAPRQIPAPASSAASTLVVPVDLPMNLEFDTGTCLLTMETQVFAPSARRTVSSLQLDFSTAAASALLDALEALEEVGYVVGHDGTTARLQ